MRVKTEWVKGCDCGFMIAPSVGASGYLRPGVAIGESKPQFLEPRGGIQVRLALAAREAFTK